MRDRESVHVQPFICSIVLYFSYFSLILGKKVESADSSLRLRVTSSDAASSQTSNARNRFSFQPKPVLGSNLQPKTMSLDRGAEHVFRDVSAAYDAQNHTPKAELAPKIETTPRTVVESKTMKKKDIPEQTTPTNTSTPTTGQEATPNKVDCSAASTDSSLTINDRSATSQPEARYSSSSACSHTPHSFIRSFIHLFTFSVGGYCGRNNRFLCNCNGLLLDTQ